MCRGIRCRAYNVRSFDFVDLRIRQYLLHLYRSGRQSDRGIFIRLDDTKRHLDGRSIGDTIVLMEEFNVGKIQSIISVFH